MILTNNNQQIHPNVKNLFSSPFKQGSTQHPLQCSSLIDVNPCKDQTVPKEEAPLVIDFSCL